MILLKLYLYGALLYGICILTAYLVDDGDSFDIFIRAVLLTPLWPMVAWEVLKQIRRNK